MAGPWRVGLEGHNQQLADFLPLGLCQLLQKVRSGYLRLLPHGPLLLVPSSGSRDSSIPCCPHYPRPGGVCSCGNSVDSKSPSRLFSWLGSGFCSPLLKFTTRYTHLRALPSWLSRSLPFLDKCYIVSVEFSASLEGTGKHTKNVLSL